MKWLVIFLITLASYSFITGDTGGAREAAMKFQQKNMSQTPKLPKKETPIIQERDL